MPFSTKSSMVFYLAALALTAGSRQRVLAANDWLVPCTQGQCSWDMPADSGSSGTLQVWGPSTAISDITPATGWRIITRCDPAATEQEVQLECADGNPDCDHLFQGAGAVDTIVRLPDDCGPMPFARVTKYWTNQPNTPGSSTVTPRASDAQVHSLALDTNFAAATPPLNGSVSFTLQGLNVKGSNGASTLTTPAPAHRRRWLSLRGPHGSPRHIHRRNFFGDMLRKLHDATAFNKTIRHDLQPVDFNGAKNLFTTSVKCTESTAIPVSSTASLSLDVDAAVHAAVSLGAVATGTLVPPKISEFGLTLGLDGNIDALFSITANLTGHVSSGAIPLFKIGIPGLSFPGILEVGPEFKVTGEIDVDLALTNIDADVRVTYNLSDVAAIFPPQHYETGGAFKQGTSEVTISAAPNITDVGASVSVTGHLTPQIDIGLSALGGIASATVFLNLDASTSLKVSAAADGSRGDKTAAPAGGAQACVDANADLAVNLGAQASFFDLFDASTGTKLFDKSFPLLQQKCVAVSNSTSVFPKQPAARRGHARRAPLDGDDTDKSNWSITSRDLDLGCPLTLASQVSQLVKAIIPAT
ncbi:hypothetical protein EDB92DRAFT_1575878 [Lactarius akahatsu]|uniref:DUF7223 domain-containing protein n=1 Tax=Lactarius akahatsu TaxID=416441 RepID=A0AAD4L7L3_9AGAM|nr:hypothetical protein EDB92DRAFT_1575878 [Lactarius akahatsu]